ncbi:MAG: hypothetical protein JNG82_13295 [Opitutaceae bacterium]|nr:hypothetical protein [Opitutaceae bacterium]HRG54972.1 hypothetical protein [Lacunisphaera sp.]
MVRYLGFANGKITDSAGDRVDYLGWAQEAAEQLHSPPVLCRSFPVMRWKRR